MRNRFLTLLLLGVIALNTIGCNSTSVSTSVSGNSVSGNDLLEGTAIIYEGDDFSVGVPASTDLVDTTSWNNVMFWECTTDVDIMCSIIGIVYQYYDSGIQNLDATEEFDNYTTYTYYLCTGDKIKVTSYNEDGNWEISDFDSNEIIWSFNSYKEVYGQDGGY